MPSAVSTRLLYHPTAFVQAAYREYCSVSAGLSASYFPQISTASVPTFPKALESSGSDLLRGSTALLNKQDQNAQRKPSDGMYRAPYYHNEGAIPGSYIIRFHLGHTVSKHFAVVGRDFGLTKLSNGYFADLDDELFDAVRGDPGVKYVEDNTRGEFDD